MIYVPANENLCQALAGQEEIEYVPGRGYTGARIGGMSIQPGIANEEAGELSPELMTDIFASVREFIGKNQEEISGLLRQHS